MLKSIYIFFNCRRQPRGSLIWPSVHSSHHGWCVTHPVHIRSTCTRYRAPVMCGQGEGKISSVNPLIEEVPTSSFYQVVMACYVFLSSFHTRVRVSTKFSPRGVPHRYYTWLQKALPKTYLGLCSGLWQPWFHQYIVQLLSRIHCYCPNWKPIVRIRVPQYFRRETYLTHVVDLAPNDDYCHQYHWWSCRKS